MSTDRLAITAVEERTDGDELLYFELAVVRYGEPEEPRRLFVGLGKQYMHLVNRSLRASEGRIPYLSIARVVEDANTVRPLVMYLHENSDPCWKPFKLTFDLEHRSRFLMYLRTAWQTDQLMNNAGVRELPCSTEQISGLGSPDSEQMDPPLRVEPYKNFKTCVLEGYSFFMKTSFESSASRMHSSATATYQDGTRNLTLTVQIQEPRALDTLFLDDSEHIRWVAIRQRQSALKKLTGVLIVRNGFYLKKMNLANDIASWTGWEVFLKSDTLIIVMISLRRRYIPPLTDSAQDIFITLTCPKHVLDDRTLSEETLLLEARLAADSFSPLVHRCTQPQALYREMIQAKLDSLLFNEDAMQWLKSSLGLQPEPKLQMEARSFVKSILKILNEESVLSSPSLLKEMGEDTKTEKDPMVFPYRMVEHRCKGKGLPEGKDSLAAAKDSSQNPLECTDGAANAFLARAARYLAYSLDGGLLGPRFALVDMVQCYINTARNRQKIDEVVGFLLHIRPMEMTKPFANKDIRLMLPDPNLFQMNTFNDRVMQSLVELGWIEKAITRGEKPEGKPGAEDEKHISFGYARFLGRLLVSQTASINLKASVCRQLSETANASEHFGELCPSLLQTCGHSSVYLKTYTTIALISLAAEHDFVKDKLMTSGILERCIENITSGDDDLTRYTLVLLTHLTKNVAVLADMHANTKVTNNLLSLLEKTPSLASKQALLAELASVLGQLCNNDEVWKAMAEDPTKPVDKLIALFQGDPTPRLSAKVMFALRMFCEKPRPEGCDPQQASKENVKKVVHNILNDFAKMLGLDAEGKPDKGRDTAGQGSRFDEKSDPEYKDKLDKAANAILLLGAVCKLPSVIQEYGDRLKNTLVELSKSPIGKLDSTADRLNQLIQRLPKTAT